MQNEKTVSIGGSAQLGYFAGAMRAARSELARVENSAADYPASEFAGVLASYREAVAVAEFDFKAEFQAMEVLEELAADVVPVAPVAVKAPRVKCPHYRAIRRAFAIAKDAGLDVSKAGKARARHAMENVIGECVNSRAEYSGSDWVRFGDAVKSGAARW